MKSLPGLCCFRIFWVSA